MGPQTGVGKSEGRRNNAIHLAWPVRLETCLACQVILSFFACMLDAYVVFAGEVRLWGPKVVGPLITPQFTRKAPSTYTHTVVPTCCTYMPHFYRLWRGLERHLDHLPTHANCALATAGTLSRYNHLLEGTKQHVFSIKSRDILAKCRWRE